MKRFFAPLLMILVLFCGTASAKTEYLYRSRANWVKLIKLSNKQLAGVKLNHPHDVSIPEMEAMLLSLHLSKGSIFKKEVKTSEVFSIEEAKKFAPYLVDALRKAEPNQVVNLAVVHERPYFIVQRDYISLANVYATDDGLHFNFSKLFAKLETDYEQASKLDRSIQKAKSLRVNLEAGPGQKLSYDNSMEIIMDPQYSFANNVSREVVAKEAYRPAMDATTAQKEPTPARRQPTPQAVSSSASSDTAARLKQLDDLKAQKLITDAEYKQKRAEILKDL